MASLPLFYHTVVPLDRDAHRNWQMANPQGFGFARESHIVPAVLDEFGVACRHLPILFLSESLGPTPVFLIGLAPGRAALINAAGTWQGRYLPAYLRRYPFILGESAEAPPVICLDDTSDLIWTEPTSHGAVDDAPLFETDGSDTALLQERVRLVIEYAQAAQRTVVFGRALQDLGLLRPLTVHGRDPASGERHALHGMLGVDKTALTALPDAELVRLHREGWLAALHAHCVSLQTLGDFTLAFAAPDGAAAATPFIGATA